MRCHRKSQFLDSFNWREETCGFPIPNVCPYDTYTRIYDTLYCFNSSLIISSSLSPFVAIISSYSKNPYLIICHTIRVHGTLLLTTSILLVFSIFNLVELVISEKWMNRTKRRVNLYCICASEERSLSADFTFNFIQSHVCMSISFFIPSTLPLVLLKKSSSSGVFIPRLLIHFYL